MSLKGPVLSIQPTVSLNIAHPSPVVSPPSSPPSPLTTMQSSSSTRASTAVAHGGNHLLNLPFRLERASSEGDIHDQTVSDVKTKPPSPLTTPPQVCS